MFSWGISSFFSSSTSQNEVSDSTKEDHYKACQAEPTPESVKACIEEYKKAMAEPVEKIEKASQDISQKTQGMQKEINEIFSKKNF